MLLRTGFLIGETLPQSIRCFLLGGYGFGKFKQNVHRGCLIWLRRVINCWDWYEWDAWIRVWTDMTETRTPPLTLIWLRHLGLNLHRYDWDPGWKLTILIESLRSYCKNVRSLIRKYIILGYRTTETIRPSGRKVYDQIRIHTNSKRSYPG